MEKETLKNIIEAVLLATDKPMSIDRIQALFEENVPQRRDINDCLVQLQQDYDGRGIELCEVGSGWRVNTRSDYSAWVSRLWEEKPSRFSRAFMETLALVAYRQPVTRAEIEEIRGVAVSSNIIKTMLERGWVRVVGHKDVPGRPELLATTKEFLDYFNLKTLEDLPSLKEIRSLSGQAHALEKELMPDLFEQTLPPQEPQTTAEDETDTVPTAQTMEDNSDAEAEQAETQTSDDDHNEEMMTAEASEDEPDDSTLLGS